ncbi:MAG: gephyrin-like molybdotransferase Glp [Methylocystaceae bacterium]
MQEFFQVVSLLEGQRLINQVLHPGVEEIGLINAVGRVLAEPVVSREELPGFSRSSVDGYAVAAVDTYGASEGLPTYLDFRGYINIGQVPPGPIGGGECMYVPTGGMLPIGADAVVMLEYTEMLGEDTMLASRAASPGENVVYQGEDVKSGEQVYPVGYILRPQDIGVLAALGVNSVKVVAKLRVGIISSGDEVVPPDQKPILAQVRDINGYVLTAACRAHGAQATFYGIVGDDFSQLKSVLHQAVNENDLVLMSGGSSVGLKDMSLQAMLDLPAAKLLFHGLAVKPGKPTLAVQCADKLVIGLPGHPVSAYMMYEVLVRPLLDQRLRHSVTATLTANLPSAAGRDDLVRVILSQGPDGLLAAPVWGKSGLMRVMTRADGYVHITAEPQGILAGQLATVWLF